MKIGIVPSIVEKYKNQFEYSCDIRLIKFLKKVYKTNSIEILSFNHKLSKKYKLIVISGANGNDLIKFNKEKKNLIRNKLDNKFYKESQKYKIPVFGICHGAQYLAQKFNSKIKKKIHLKSHYVILSNKKKIFVNSYHTKIIFKLGNKLTLKGFAQDGSVEYFSHEQKKITGIMWHPERNKKFKKIDIDIIKKLCS